MSVLLRHPRTTKALATIAGLGAFFALLEYATPNMLLVLMAVTCVGLVVVSFVADRQEHKP